MDVKNVNPVVNAFTGILTQIGFQEVVKKGVSVSSSSLTNKGIMINVGVVGTLKGSIIIGMTEENAKKFASVMMMGMPVAELDAMAQSALGEMANMVCAHSCTNFAEAGINGLDISPPTLLVGEGATIKLSAPYAIIVNLGINDFEAQLLVGLFEE